MRPSALSQARVAQAAFAAAGTIAVVAACVALPAAIAEAATIELNDGTTIQAERFYPTYTALVVLTPGFDMRLIANGDVKAIDGQPYAQIYWGEKASRETPELAAPGPSGAPTPLPAPSASPARQSGPAGTTQALLPLNQGTFRRYTLEKTRTAWVRRGRTMARHSAETIAGVVRETVVGAPIAANGTAAVRESSIERQGTEPAREYQVLNVIENRPDGYYLLAQSVEDPRLATPRQETRIGVPPELLPRTLQVGQTWTVGPFYRLGCYEAGRMSVVGRENVTVPAGTYPAAYKIQGFGHVFGCSQQLKNGRLVTNHGTVETTTWLVPGLGPVKEVEKLHLHQDFFPRDTKAAVLPLVVEARSTRTLTEFSLGR